MVERLIKEYYTDGELCEEAWKMIKSWMARVDESIGGIGTKVVNVISEDNLNGKRGQERREMVNGVAEGALHSEVGKGGGEIVNGLVKFSSHRETFERGREVVKWVVEVA